ncbi:MAG: hypothetical protein ACLRIP_11230 [Blautia massiliensis (ex Durand et al. 2017)]
MLYSYSDYSRCPGSFKSLSSGNLQSGIWLFLEDYWKEFKSGILKNLPAGLLTGGLGFYAYYLMSLAGNFDRGTTHDVLIGCGNGVMIFAILIGALLFRNVCHAGSGSWRIVENTLILMTVEWKMSIVIVVTVVIAGGILLALAPYSLFLLLTIGVSFPQMLVYACVNRAVERRVLQPLRGRMVGKEVRKLLPGAKLDTEVAIVAVNEV